jgi:phosphoglucomutase
MASLTAKTVPTEPFQGQKPGTSGLRKKVRYIHLEEIQYGWRIVW